MSFHVEVSGIGTDGAAFCDQAAASDISDRGCQILLPREVRVGDLLTLRVVQRQRNELKNPQFLYKVIWVDKKADAWVAGLAALEEGNPWRVNFPSAAVATK